MKETLFAGWIFLISMLPCWTQESPGKTVSVSFNKTPLNIVAGYIAGLTGKPVLLLHRLSGNVDCNRQNISHEELLKVLKQQFESLQMQIVEVKGTHWKIIPVSHPKPKEDPAHLELEIRPDSILIEKQPIAREALLDSLKQQAKAGGEIWMRDTVAPQGFPRFRPGIGAQLIQTLLAEAKVSPDHTYLLFTPSK